VALTFSLKLTNLRPSTNLNLAEIEFQRWMNVNDKHYLSDEEYQTRFSNYLASVQRVKERNEKSAQIGGATYGITKFSDLTPQEFANMYLTAKGFDVPMEEREVLPLSNKVPADSFDWRNRSKITDVKDQAQCGSCWAFSVTENIESVWMIAKGLTPSNMKPLAPQQIVDCDKSDGGCNGGNPPTAYEYVMKAGGMDTESTYPYRARNQNCAFKPNNVEAKISNWKYATKTKNENEIKSNLVAWAPLSICVDAEPWQDYRGGVMTRTECGTSLDHCVQLTGYNGAVWNVRNSWGRNWGESGYIRLQMGTNTCGMAQEATTAVV